MTAFMGTPDDVLVGGRSELVIRWSWRMARELMACEDKSVIDTLNEGDVKCVLHILLSRYRGISAAIPEAMLLRHLDAVVMETDMMAKAASDIAPGKIGLCQRASGMYITEGNDPLFFLYIFYRRHVDLQKRRALGWIITNLLINLSFKLQKYRSTYLVREKRPDIHGIL